MGCWKTVPTRVRRSVVSSARLIPVVSVPSITTRPASGVISVAATASRLDLPEPEGPTTAVTDPGGTVSVTSSRAVRRPAPSG